MASFQELSPWLETWTDGSAERRAIAATVRALADAGRAISELVAAGPLAGDHAGIVGENTDGDQQKALDIRAHEDVLAALAGSPVAVVGSEEAEEPVLLDPDAPLALAIDPLDGSSNIDVNMSIGTIFSILPAIHGDLEASFRQPGTRQLAAGYLVYGPMTELVLTLGQGTHVFVLDRLDGVFRLAGPAARIDPATAEFAINASNYRFWDDPVRRYVDDCLSGDEGVRTKNFNMRWIGSLVAEASRILSRGGIFLYPGDSRSGYGDGRLRLVYEANPIAMVIEQAGGAATNGAARILDLVPGDLHQRVPLVFGSRVEVERVAGYIADPHSLGDHSPLFGKRGLFRA